MATNMVIKVSADTKDAADKLRKLGYNVEEVKKSTDKAEKSTSAWDKALDKASKDNIKNLVNMGAKILTVTTAVNGLYKGLKACLDEALKQDSVAKTRLTEIQSVWSNIKADFGQGLLDSVSPALKSLYDWLVAIEKEVARMAGSSGINTALTSAYKSNSGNANYHYDFSDKSTGALEVALDALNNPGNPHGDSAAVSWAKSQIQAELDWRATHDGASYGKFGVGLTGDAASGVKLNWGESAEQSYWRRYGEHIARQGNQQPVSTTELTLQEMLNMGSASLPVVDDGRAASRAKYAFYGGNYSVDYGKYLNEAGTAYWDEAVGAWKDINSLIEESNNALEESQHTWEDYYDAIANAASNAFSAMDSVMNTYYSNEIARIKESENSEEDKAKQIDEVRRKQFDAQKANSIAQALIDTSSGVMNIWSKWGDNPVMAGILTAALAGTSAAEVAAIATQKYTGLATGGIVSSPTHALIGEGAEKEAVMPLSKLEEFVQAPERSGAIVININVADGGSRKDIAEEVYFAIERAQRTGLLPRWKYA